MEIHKTLESGKDTLVLQCSSDEEAHDILDFARPGDLFVGAIYRDRWYKHPIIILRKD